MEYRDLQQPGSSIETARLGEATIETVAALDEVKEGDLQESEGEPRTIWRLARGGLAASSFLCLPHELCQIATQSDNVADACGLDEALKVLTAAAEGTGQKPLVTWIAPRPEFDTFQLQQLNLESGAAANVMQRVLTPLLSPVQAL